MKTLQRILFDFYKEKAIKLNTQLSYKDFTKCCKCNDSIYDKWHTIEVNENITFKQVLGRKSYCLKKRIWNN